MKFTTYIAENGMKLVMAALVCGSWVGTFEMSRAILRGTYDAGVLLSKASGDGRREARLRRLLTAVPIYAAVFNLLLWAVASSGILVLDMNDNFGFAQTVLSWEYLIHPNYVGLIAGMALVSVVTTLVVFSRAKKGGIDAQLYEKVTRACRIAFLVTGAMLLMAALFMDALRDAVSSDDVMPAGPEVAKFVTLSILLNNTFNNDEKAIYQKMLATVPVPSADRALASAFVDALKSERKRFTRPKHDRSLRWAMKDAGFDHATIRAAAEMYKDYITRKREWLNRFTNEYEKRRRNAPKKIETPTVANKSQNQSTSTD